MTRIPPRVGLIALLALAGNDPFPSPPARGAEGTPLTVADLAGYRAALSGKGKGEGASDGPPVAVDFRELWGRPASYQGRRVRVQGRLVRRFRQGAYGTFPPLEEAWIVSPAGDPFCLVFPATAGDTESKSKSKTKTKTKSRTADLAGRGPVRFAGTFLKLLQYEGGDGPRLAPLIVGPAPPVTTDRDRGAAPARVAGPHSRLTWLDWTLGLAAAAVVVLVLAVQHLRRPPRRLLDVDGDIAIAPAPLFDDAAPPRPGSSSGA